MTNTDKTGVLTDDRLAEWLDEVSYHFDRAGVALPVGLAHPSSMARRLRLRAASITPPAPERSKEVGVKPLGPWRSGYCDEQVKIEQASFGGLYQVRVLDGVINLDWPDRTPPAVFDTVEAAKAAAQADYEQRILSALVLPDGMEERLQEAIDAFDADVADAWADAEQTGERPDLWPQEVTVPVDLLRQAQSAIAAMREERDEADNALVDKYRDPKTGHFNFPSDVAAIVRRLEATEAQVKRLTEDNEARIKALKERLNEIRELNMTAEDENGHRWANSDLIDQTIMLALSTLNSEGKVE